jgi:hypothetical protein
MLPNLSDRINTCLCLIYLLFVSDAYYSSAPTYIYIFIYTREIPNPSHLPTFHPHSKTLSIIIEACCSHNASQPTPPDPSDPIDIPFSSHTYYYSAPKYSLLLLPSYYYPLIITQSPNYHHGSTPLIKFISIPFIRVATTTRHF